MNPNAGLALALLLVHLPGACDCRSDEKHSDDTDVDGPNLIDAVLVVDGKDLKPWIQRGLRNDDGFGTAVLWEDSSHLLVAGPFSDPSHVYRVSPDTVDLLLEGVGQDLLGVGMTRDETGRIWFGAPWRDGRAGAILDAEGVLAQAGAAGSLLGGRLVGGASWTATTATGWRSADAVTDGPSGPTASPPKAIALRGDDVILGMPWGETLAWGGTVDLRRQEGAGAATRDEAGFALATGDLNGDEQPDLVIGAPGQGEVWVVTNPELASNLEDLETQGAAIRLTGQGGRFGHAIAVTDIDGDGNDDLMVGAPQEGTTNQGAFYLFPGPILADAASDSAAMRIVGNEDDDQLGWSVAAESWGLAVGAPGGAGAKGMVMAWSE